ncbi:MAG: protein kinase [Gemmatimonadota bacterium]|nr:protein kinase [Gemmatimonadota bacterium]
MSRVSGGHEESPDAGGEDPRVIADRYEVIRVLGEGSSARTLLCADRHGERRVAVKELHFEHLEDWKYLELFEREARVLSLLDHPGIPRVFDFFQGPGVATTLYIVQEFMEGASLRERMESGPMLGQEEVHDLALGLLDVLDYLHGRAPPVLHRDIKPSNVLVRDEGAPALVDFGGVCFGWLPPGEAGATVVGTFGYMPPEQLLGQSVPTSDLYALGATLLHVTTGKPPNEFPFDSGRIEVPADLPAGDALTRLIEALLRPAPRDRPQTAAGARTILTDRPQKDPVATSGTTAPSPSDFGTRSATTVSGEGPRFVDLGPSARDPNLEFKDVYRNLVNPLFPAKRLWSWGVHAFWVSFAGVASVATLGIAPLLYAGGVRDRKRRYGDLFRDGRFTPGIILSVEEGPLYATFKYQFEVEGVTYVAFLTYAQEMATYWGEGDVVPVLYDPDDPQRSCFVYR